MTHVDIDTVERPEHPLDVVERLAAAQQWSFDRDDTDEISIAVTGGFADYHVAFTWLDDIEALHVACAFDLKVPEARRTEALRLVALVNERLWVGHFDLWRSENVVMFRHSLLLAGGATPNGSQCETLMKIAVEACDRHYQAFQFVIWAGKSAAEAMECTILETMGEC